MVSLGFLSPETALVRGPCRARCGCTLTGVCLSSCLPSRAVAFVVTHQTQRPKALCPRALSPMASWSPQLQCAETDLVTVLTCESQAASLAQHLSG